MACADCNGKRIYARAFYKIHRLVRVCIRCIRRVNVYFVLNASQLAKLRLYHYAAFMCVIHDFFRLCYIFLIIQMGTIKHYGSKPVFDTVPANFKIRTMVKMQCDIQPCFLDCRVHHRFQIFRVRIFQRGFGNLKDNSGILRLCRSHNALNNLHIVDIECTNGVTALKSLFKHLFCRH